MKSELIIGMIILLLIVMPITTSYLTITDMVNSKSSIVQSEEPFLLSIDESTLRHGWITKDDNTSVYAVYVKGLFGTWDGAIPTETKYFGITFGEKATAGSWIKYRKVGNVVWNTLVASDFQYKSQYVLDNGKTVEDVYYTSFATIPSNYSSEFIIYAELKDKPKRSDFAIYFGTGSTVLTVNLGTDLVVTSNYSSSTYYNAMIDVSEGLLIFNSTYENSTYQISGSAITYDVISNTNISILIAIPETRSNFTFNPTNIIENQTTVRFNTTDASWFGQQTVTATQAYLSEPNLTKVTVTFPSILNKYDLFGLNLTNYLGWNPANILNVWYGSYTGNTDNSTKKDTNDYASWQDTCAYGNTTGQVGCWNFNEGQGVTAKDRANNSQNNNDGTLTGMNIGIDNGTSGWTTSGKYGNAIRFDGVNDYVDTNLIDLNSDITMSTWFYAVENAGSVVRGIIGIRDTTNSNRIYVGQNANSNQYNFVIGSSNIQIITGALNLNRWYYISATYNNNTGVMKLYLDGVYIGTNTASRNNSGYKYFIGALTATTTPVADTYFKGSIDEVRIYNRALSAAEILDQYNMKKDYFDSMYNEEGSSLAALDEWNLIVQNGTVSTTPPSITIQQPTNATINTNWFNATAADDNGISACWYNQGGANQTLTNSTGNWNYQNATLTDGSYTVNFYCNDTVGNENISSIVFTYDSTPPSITINQPLNATDLDGTYNVTFSETVNDSLYSLNGAANVSMGAIISYQTILTSGYLQGANEIRVCANDSVGNMNCTSRVWTTEPNTTVHHGIDLINLRFYPDNLLHKYLMPINENSSNPAYKVEPTTYPDSTLEAWLDENMTAGSWYTISNASSYTTGINLTDSVQGVNWTVPSLSNVSVWIWLSLDAPNLSLLNMSNRINFNFTR